MAHFYKKQFNRYTSQNITWNIMIMVHGLSKRYRLVLVKVYNEYFAPVYLLPVWPGLAIYWTLGNILKPLITIEFAQISDILKQFL